jgi:hypothetical protein
MDTTSQSNRTTQQESVDHSERILQLLCLIAQTLRRIETQLGNITPTNTRQNNIVAFTGGRQ